MPIPLSRVAVLVSLMFLLPISAATSMTDVLSVPKIETSPREQRGSVYEIRYERVWQLVNDNFLYRDRLTNWQDWKHKFTGKLTSESATKRAISQMLESLRDDYTYFRDRKATQEKSNEDESLGVVSGRMLPGGIGYLKIRTFETNHVAAETRRALQ